MTGLDLSLDLLGYAGALARQTGVAGRVFFCQGDMRRLPFDDDAFDWAWSADCAGYPAGDLLPALGEMRRVVRPGGLVALLGWTSQQLLPGYALLEARLNATCSAYAPFLRDWGPEAHFMRAPDAFRRAGIAAPLARTFLGEAQAPLSPAVRRALTSLFDMLWGVRQPETSDADWSDYQRLCRPESPEFILDQRDYYAFFTCTLFCGLK